MPKFELTINVKYVQKWGFWEGVREHISNGVDAEKEYNAPLKVTFYNNTIRIENEGAELSHDVLLFGTSSKQGTGGFIGQFGEGLKLGTLALIRAGHPVVIRSGGEVWTPSIEHSDKYGADILVFDVKGGNKPKKRVRVEIENVEESDWLEIKDKFLFLSKVGDSEIVHTQRGDLLLGERFRGRIYVKGVHVENNTEISYGYNFLYAETDRDRKMIASHEFKYEASQIWNLACASRPDLLDPFYRLLLDAKADVQGLDYLSSYLDSQVLSGIQQRFQNQYGSNAIPVDNLSESKEVEHLGRTGIVVPAPLGKALAQTMGDKEAVKKTLREEIVRKYSWHELDETGKRNLEGALALIAKVRDGVSLDIVDVVEYRSALLGQFHGATKRISVSFALLNDFYELLATLVHEVSHLYGGDGELGHVRAIENLWRDIVKHMRTIDTN